MKAASILARGLPFLVLLLVGAAAIHSGLNPPPAPPPEIPPEVLAAAREPRPAPSPRPSPPPGAALEGFIEAPESVCLGDPLPITLGVRNTGTVPLRDVILYLKLPPESHTRQLAAYVRFVAPEILPGASFERAEIIIAKQAGTLALEGFFRSAEGVETRTKALVRLPTAVLLLDPQPIVHDSRTGRRSLCATVTNVGGAPARDVVVRLPQAASRPIVWPELAPGREREACFELPPAPFDETVVEVEASARAADIARAAFP